MRLPVVHSDLEYNPNPNPSGETSFEEFWEVREALRSVIETFGATGPESDVRTPVYWLVDDQYNDDRYHNLEICELVGWQEPFFQALVSELQNHPGWGISIGGLESGYLLIFADRVVVQRAGFEQCHDFAEVISAAKLSAESLHERKFGPLGRQMDYIRPLLSAAIRLARDQGFAYLATFDRYQLFDQNAIWMLQSREHYELSLDVNSSPVSERPVKSDGTVLPEHCEEFGDSAKAPDYWLYVYLAVDGNQRAFNVGQDANKPITTITIGEPITDDQLQALNPH